MEPPFRIELEPRLGRCGILQVSFNALPWGAASVIEVNDHPLGGALRAAEAFFLDALLTRRNQLLFRNLAHAVEGSRAPDVLTEAQDGQAEGVYIRM